MEKVDSLRILDITAPDINNGNGIRITLWVAGCTHRCKGCHNSWTWKYNQGLEFDKECNQDIIFKKLKEWLDRDYVEGLTFSGGDPLCQNEKALLEILYIIHWFREAYPKKNIWLYTGYEYDDPKLNELQKEIISKVDVVVDGPYREELRELAKCPFRGSTNQRIIYIKENEKD